MPPQHFTVLCHKVSLRRLLSRILLNKCFIVPVRHKANILTVLFMGVKKTVLLRQSTHLLLCQLSQGQTDMGKLLLGKLIEHIALILCLIQCLPHLPSAARFIPADPRVMPRHDLIAPKQPRPLVQLFKLHITVAVNTGIGRLAM